MSNITLEQARKVVDAALKKSEELGVKMNIPCSVPLSIRGLI